MCNEYVAFVVVRLRLGADHNARWLCLWLVVGGGGGGNVGTSKKDVYGTRYIHIKHPAWRPDNWRTCNDNILRTDGRRRRRRLQRSTGQFVTECMRNG